MKKFLITVLLLIIFIFISGYSYSGDNKCKKHNYQIKNKDEKRRIEKLEKENKELKDDRNAMLKQYIDIKVEQEHGGSKYDPFDSYLHRENIYRHNKR